MREALTESLKQRFKSFDDVIASNNDKQMGEKLTIDKHKSLGEHLWCIVGARESYAKAITSGAWEGFSCSLTGLSQLELAKVAKRSAEDVVKAIESVGQWTDDREGFLLALAEHEVMHEGQIIRHLYGVKRDIPESVKWA